MDVGGGEAAGLEGFREILRDEGNVRLADRTFDADDVGKNLSRLHAHGVRRRAGSTDGRRADGRQARGECPGTQANAQTSQSHHLLSPRSDFSTIPARITEPNET